ncbi:GAF domain-containing protein [Sphingomonas parva]|uniref:GAF domain-containing protein n=1 Tax=Sphingomonas parva TaxID=2555898 RepID=A0A4Y8ZNE4_9SPHN|nr:histidine kinase dimerization/phosphoacceptor domain -containing protein [Sphingomonas parva]TFI56675.1 GAF domain-containing protein [Sphingomonas parva]
MADADPKLPDLTACDREPIHVPGAIQPHGLLLVLDSDGTIARHAGDFARLLGVEASPLGRPVEDLLGAEGAALLGGTGYRGTFAAPSGGRFDLIAHDGGSGLIVELEPAPAAPAAAAEALAEVRDAVRAIGAADTPTRACLEAARAVQRFSGYDRIMVYRFQADGAGRVIAEALAEGSAPLLNQHFPASDVPQQARALYLRNRIRLIPDAGYTPAPLVGRGEALDMSDCILRSVSPIHLQYLRNMGVAASASLSIVVDDALWGLIACHAGSVRTIPYAVREMCSLVAETLSLDLKRRGDAETHAQVLRLARRREDLLPLIAHADNVEEGLAESLDEIGKLIPSDGVAVWSDGAVHAAGAVPDEAALNALGKWLLGRGEGAAIATAQLGGIYPAAESFAGHGSGLAAAIVRRDPGLVLMWLRAEQVETVNWAGNPHKDDSSPAAVLTPRKSFELWRETVRGRSLPWLESEKESARRFAEAVRELSEQKQVNALNRQLRETVGAKDALIDRKDLMMREVHHRVQNSLQLVSSMLHLQASELTDEAARHQFELARERVLAVAMAHRRLWRADEADMVNLEPFLSELTESLVESWGPAWSEQLALDVAPARVPTSDAVIVAMLVTELITNAMKHAYAGAPGPIAIGVREISEGEALSITVSDSGKGFDGAVREGSFGTRLTKGLVRQLRGRMEFGDNRPGARAMLTIPYRRSAPPA